jgi:hypothetical protein
MTALALREQAAAQQVNSADDRAPVQPGARIRRAPAPAEIQPRPASRPYTFHSIAARPEQRAVVDRVDAEAYPEFMGHTDLAPWWPVIYGTFPEYQLILADAQTGRHLAHGNLLPFAWDRTPEGLPHSAVEMVRRALHDRRHGVPPTVLGALQAVVDPAEQGAGLSVRMLQGMAGLAAALRLPDLVAPIRPTEKALDPLAPLDEYVARVRPDGLPADPWQRVHARLGAVPIAVEEGWLTVTASVEEWARLTGVGAPPTGPYLVPGALVPIKLDAERRFGRYVEPHLWMRYRIA